VANDPISITIRVNGGGEEALLRAPPTTAPYRPGDAADYAPNTPGTLPIRVVPELKIEHVPGAVGACTFSATEEPAGMNTKGTKLFWRNHNWTVMKWRERYWKGQINGYTLYLEA
jgi:hypothetical protein